MKRKAKRTLAVGTTFASGFILWTILILKLDVQAAGVNSTDIGFATFNTWFHSLTGVNMVLYNITDWLSVIPVAVCTAFGALGLAQLIKRKSLFRVDRDIIALGVYYVAVAVCYLAFEIVPINYRPILIDGRMEASYPSSTTLLVLSVMPTLIFQVNRRAKSAATKRAVTVLTTAFSLFMVTGRLVSGVHWATDIIGALLLSAGLYCTYKAVALPQGKGEYDGI